MKGIISFIFLLCLYPMSLCAQSELIEDQKAIFVETELELDQLIKQIEERYVDNIVFIDKFRKSQNLWRMYVDSYIDMVFPAEDKLFEYGSLVQLCIYQIKTEKINDRILELETWIVGIPEGDICTGSRPIIK